MNTEYYIERSRTLTQAQDYNFLRAEGQKYIESLSHKLWTDYNTHDPGITILEALCYAITELGYRSNFKIEDLLANKDGLINNQTFFSARNILTNAPLTMLDYRKMIIDIEGINNAWIIHSKNSLDAAKYPEPLDNEIPIYINTKEDTLSFSNIDVFGDPLNRLPIRGLNKIVVELSEDLNLGDLNQVALEHSWLEEDRFVEVNITLEFDSWNDPKADLLKLMNKPSKFEFKMIEQIEDHIKITLLRTQNNAQTLTLYISPYDIQELPLVKDYFGTEKPIADAINSFYLKKEKVSSIYTEVRNGLNDNRNLTEDWMCIETVTNVDIGVCADIELDNKADAEEVLAKIQQAIDTLLNPPIRFYTLNQLLEQEMSPRQIFNGPALTHGFLIDEEVQNSQIPDCIHVSDIIAALMDIPGIKAVNNVLITAYDQDGKPIEDAKSKSWCLSLDGQHRPVFDFKKSKLLLFRDGIPFVIPEKGKLEFNQGVFYLKTQNDTYKLKNPEKDFPVPTGTYYDLDEYYSIQNDFPVTYGIGEGHLSDKSPPIRKAQAKQLKAYLQHFDQLLADFFNQLHHAKELLDINTVHNTYFPKYIEQIPGVEKDDFAEEVYASTFKNSIEKGTPDHGRSLYENDALFYDRRNRMLDHLLARFGESFNDYVFMMYSMQENAKGIAELAIQEQELIEDKQNFLKQYPKVSYRRGLGINYLQEASLDSSMSWGLNQRGGYEKRVAGLLGINNIDLDDIVDTDPKNSWKYETEIGVLQFSLLNSVPLPQEEKWELAQLLINNITSYRVDTYAKSYIYFVNKDNKKIARLDKKFDTPLEAEEFIPIVYQAINSTLENFYCMEHILLRPLVDNNLIDDNLLSVCLNGDCLSEANNDPYSFKATLVLPGWLARFRNRYFRRYAERIFRQEAPAHVLVKICWVGREDMIKFQTAYKKWIGAYKKFKAKDCIRAHSPNEKKTYNKALSELIDQLKELNTIYDEGTLYDCKESELDNPIILNNSSLGTLQNIQL